MNLHDYPLPVVLFAAIGFYTTIYIALMALLIAGDRAVCALLRRRKVRRTGESA